MACLPKTVFTAAAIIIMCLGLIMAFFYRDNVSLFGQMSLACSNLCCIFFSAFIIGLVCGKKPHIVGWVLAVFCIVSWLGTLGRVGNPIVNIN